MPSASIPNNTTPNPLPLPILSTDFVALRRKQADGSIREGNAAVGIFAAPPTAPVAPSPFLFLTKVLTNAQILTLPSLGFELLASPGPGKMILPLFCSLLLDQTRGSYSHVDSNSDSNGYFSVGDRMNYIANEKLVGGFLSKMLAYVTPFQEASGGVPTYQYAAGFDGDYFEDSNLMLLSTNNQGDFHGGHALNTLKVNLAYLIIDQ